MPYIPEVDRHRAATEPATPGELNFAITALLFRYLGRIDKRPLSYATVAEALGACTEAAAEFRRRVLVPLEERKMRESGDVFPYWLLAEASTGDPNRPCEPGCWFCP